MNRDNVMHSVMIFMITACLLGWSPRAFGDEPSAGEAEEEAEEEDEAQEGGEEEAEEEEAGEEEAEEEPGEKEAEKGEEAVSLDDRIELLEKKVLLGKKLAVGGGLAFGVVWVVNIGWGLSAALTENYCFCDSENCDIDKVCDRERFKSWMAIVPVVGPITAAGLEIGDNGWGSWVTILGFASGVLQLGGVILMAAGLRMFVMENKKLKDLRDEDEEYEKIGVRRFHVTPLLGLCPGGGTLSLVGTF